MEFKYYWSLLLLCLFIVKRNVFSTPIRKADKDFLKNMHPASIHWISDGTKKLPNINPEELTSKFWQDNGKNAVLQHLKKKQNRNTAKNVILFLGDGMSVSTLTMARIYNGQLNGFPGEEQKLVWEDFPYSGFSKTYCVDYQVTDSASSATAYMCGVKGNKQTIGVNANVKAKDCQGMADSNNHVYSIQKWFQDDDRSTGIVTTTDITDASPAASYAHTAFRYWNVDSAIVKDNEDPNVCKDTAYQLINKDVGAKMAVLLGGGRKNFLPNTMKDEKTGELGERLDKANLIQEWQDRKKAEGKTNSYVSDRSGLLKSVGNTDYLLGLFDYGHLPYHLQSDPQLIPSLAEMTEAAIKILKKNKNGFFLFVEGGLIDHGHHANKAHLAADETVEFAKAIEVAKGLVDLEETLIVVTADHAHTMSVSGYGLRGNPIFGMAEISKKDMLPYPTLTYATGMGYYQSHDSKDAAEYQFPAYAPMSSASHGGDDVAVFAVGPWSHLFTGVFEESAIAHLMAFAADLHSEVKQTTQTTTSGAQKGIEINIIFLTSLYFSQF